MQIINDVFIKGCSIPYKLAATPEVDLQTMFIRAAREVLQTTGTDPSHIRTVCIGTMGGFTNPPSEIGATVCDELGLEPYRVSQEKDTSSTGASALFNAFQEVAYGPTEENCVLVLAGEQMYPAFPAGFQRTEKTRQILKAQSMKNTALISGVIGADDRRYGLTMPLIGDMLENRLIYMSGFSREEWKNTIFPAMRKRKMERGQKFRQGHFSGKTFDLEKFRNSPMITPNYARDTMVPQSSGVVAMILTNRRPEPVRGKVVRIRSVGQGFTSPLVTRRKGPLFFPEAVYRAIRQLCQRAGISVQALQKTTCRFDHDAFKAIERIMGFILGGSEEQVVRDILDGRNNPYGGLEISGHAIGASGLLQVAQAFILATEWQNYAEPTDFLPGSESAGETESKPSAILCSSVGAALTNLFFSFIEVYDEGQEIDHAYTFDPEEFDRVIPREGIFSEYESRLQNLHLGSHDGIVISYTIPNRNLLEFSAEFDVWVNLVQTGSGKVLALSRKELEIGDRVAFEDSGFPFRIIKRHARRHGRRDPLSLDAFDLKPCSKSVARKIIRECEKILKQ